MTKQILQIVLVACLALAAGWWGRGLLAERNISDELPMERADGSCAGGTAPLYWKAPMDPTYIRDEPGKSPMGMDLVPVCAAAGGAALDDAVQIDPQTVQNIGVRTETVVRRDLSRSIRALGRIAYDETRVEHVHTKVDGWVEALHVDFVGQRVRKGQPLLEVYSPELVATQEELLLAARYRAATKDSPFEDVRSGGASLHEATRRRLELWDISKRDIDKLLETGEIQKTLTLYAPTSGIVTQLGVRSGMKVGPNQNLYTIADVSNVWVRAEVYEYELPWLSLGQIGVVELSYLPGKLHSGPLTYISPFLDPKTRTAEVRLELANPDGELRPEMFGNTLLQGTSRLNVIAIPSEAVIRSGRRNLVIRALGEGRFEPRSVTLGMDSGDGWLEITDGLAVGDEIVVSSQFLIDSESNLQEAIRKLLAASEHGTTEAHEEHQEMSPPSEAPPNMDEGMHEMSMPMGEEAPMDHSAHSSHQDHGE
ncbi:MAG: efflux RND transporter periplasmic adaptor subunit [Deltaproteobacteria bacterium]|nr:efflux RND transporter periplasmic adaptor subunit [Deltaproteobacteria bacterium]MBW2394857.1 efflux RND transporter periplasmic adaptor subunit [Deltaproteobacteria bacterium]